ncbi:GNAT family N-acetyltransferase [Rhodococcus sp. C3V]|uniref:GNAT family N-acetyltransferase n=1 Tax=Rhodococcus sp. C3V TaxID=3034165 RepID=UPI0023E098FE|nr:GNAT family N-acetyltransferase [Rhodococcus sp. C3V]MDF3319530.1 GNAT family N-acetyltransferase [Rhodococcus sp. C3V]
MTTEATLASFVETVDTDVDTHPLDDPVRQGLRGHHAQFARWAGRVARYDPTVAPFVGHPPELDAEDWENLLTLVGPGGTVGLRGFDHRPPEGWRIVDQFGSVQMDGSALEVSVDPSVELLGTGDVPEILALIERTKPGPFLPRTVEMGSYYGIRVDGRLVAMAGERLHPPGWTEISAVCTDSDFRGRGLGTTLIRAVAAGIRERGELPFLHAAQSNTNAIRLYESLGFVLRKRSRLTAVQAPA